LATIGDYNFPPRGVLEIVNIEKAYMLQNNYNIGKIESLKSDRILTLQTRPQRSYKGV